MAVDRIKRDSKMIFTSADIFYFLIGLGKICHQKEENTAWIAWVKLTFVTMFVSVTFRI
jgi:hypothetical protein